MIEARQFLIDLVSISAVMRIAVLRGDRFSINDIMQKTGLVRARIIEVLVIALTSDFRDDQLEILVSQMDNLNESVHPLGIMTTRMEYPPLEVMSALMGTSVTDLLYMVHTKNSHRMIYKLTSVFGERVDAWVASNINNAMDVLKK